MPDWKGMLKKGTELAKQAKSELESSGLLDNLEQRQSAPPEEPQQASPADEVREILGPDHPNPFHLLTNADVAAALATDPAAVAGPTAVYGDDAGGPSWTVATGAGDVQVDVYLHASSTTPDELLGSGDEALEPLPDIGDRAVIAGDAIAVMQGGEVVAIYVTGPSSGTHRDALQRLARTVAAGLPDFRQYAIRMSAPGGPVLTDVLSTEDVAAVMGCAMETPAFERDDDEVRVVWHSLQAPLDDGDRVRVEVAHYIVDPFDKQRQMAATGSVWAKAAAELGETMKQQFAELFKPVPGPWDEGYLGPTQAYFKKGGRSFKVEIAGGGGDYSAQVKGLAEHLATRV